MSSSKDDASTTKMEHAKGPMFSKKETEYLRRRDEYLDSVYPAHPDSVQEGFEYFFSKRPDLAPPEGVTADEGSSMRLMRFRGIPRRKMVGMLGTVRNLRKGMNQSWDDIETYFDDLQPTPFEPKPGLWEDLQSYVRSKWDDVFIGFTELPPQMIFRGKFTLFKYALVVAQEMKRDKIDHAPEFEAGKEVMRVYASLGLVVNEIARWLRKRGVRCQSNHPLGGLVNTPSLAGKAGMGWQGRSGLLVTPEFGTRQRTAPVFIEHKYFEFTDNRDHNWIEEYCELCQRCEKECPQQAIYSEKVVAINDVPGVGAIRTCIDRELCFDYFIKTLGCSVCVKVCPFSHAGDTYDRLKAIVEKNRVSP